MGAGGGTMTADVEGVVAGRVAGKVTLRRSGRSEALHLSLSSSDWHVRTCHPVVQPFAPMMNAGKAQVAQGSVVGAIVVSYNRSGYDPPGSSAACASSAALHPCRAWPGPRARSVDPRSA